MHSIGGGYSFVTGKNRYKLPFISTERYQNNETYLQINFSVLYHFHRF